MFRLHDSAVDPNAPGAPLPPVGSLISVNREQLWIGSLQEQLDVRVVIEEWDYASNREEAARRYAELYDAYRNPLADEFQQAKKQLEGLERYLIQLWREYLSPPPRKAGQSARRLGRAVSRPGLVRIPAPRRPGLSPVGNQLSNQPEP